MFVGDASVIKDLDEHEIDRCLQWLDMRPLGIRYAFTFYLETGARCSEGMLLTLGDARTAMRRRMPFFDMPTLKRKKKHTRPVPIKTKSIHPNHHWSHYTLLRDWLNFRDKEPNDHRLITMLNGNNRCPKPDLAIGREILWKAIKEVFINTGIPERRLHDLRHTFAIRFLKSGGTLPALQRILGHASLTNTSIYVQPRMEDIFSQMGIKIK